ncbi:MAG: hypothetical protein O8C64_14430 [Candidatus Methanoperedens sp.]|nr:hypothetical protein [Candidatus Methanoperedens sp.]MCZ7406736.1 hypothetical protein [Candidatus Methanoperedens sp.]
MEIQIYPKDEVKVLKFVKTVGSLYDPNSTAISGSENIQKSDEYIYALTNLITIHGIKNFNHKQYIIRNAIEKSKDIPQMSLDDFKISLFEARKEMVSKYKKKYYVVFPLKIRYDSIKKRQFTLLDTKIKVSNYNYLQKNFKYEELNNQKKYDEKIKESLNSSRTYFIIEVREIDDFRAVQYSYEKIELLRSIINFINQYMRLHFQSEPEPLSLIYPSKVFFIFDANRMYLNKRTTDITFDSKEINFNSYGLTNVIEDSEKLIKKLNSFNEGWLRKTIIQALNLHNNALDYYDKKWLSFLSFWQIFELIARCSDNNLRQDDVCKRMLSFFKEKDPYDDIIQVLKRKRNDFVHYGELDFTDNDINMIIGIAQMALMFLINNASKIKDTRSLTFFYGNIQFSKEDIELNKSLLNYIKKIKYS